MVLLEPDRFLTELERCLTASKVKKKGTVLLTMKRYDGRTKPKPRNQAEAPPAPDEYSCLVRATYDDRKINTRVAHKDLNKFQIAFSALMRTGLSNIGKKPATTTASTQSSVPAAAVPSEKPAVSSVTSPKPAATAKSKSAKKAP